MCVCVCVVMVPVVVAVLHEQVRNAVEENVSKQTARREGEKGLVEPGRDARRRLATPLPEGDQQENEGWGHANERRQRERLVEWRELVEGLHCHSEFLSSAVSGGRASG